MSWIEAESTRFDSQHVHRLANLTSVCSNELFDLYHVTQSVCACPWLTFWHWARAMSLAQIQNLQKWHRAASTDFDYDDFFTEEVRLLHHCLCSFGCLTVIVVFNFRSKCKNTTLYTSFIALRFSKVGSSFSFLFSLKTNKLFHESVFQSSALSLSLSLSLSLYPPAPHLLTFLCHSLFCSISVLRHIIFITSHLLYVIVIPTIFEAPNKLKNSTNTRF